MRPSHSPLVTTVIAGLLVLLVGCAASGTPRPSSTSLGSPAPSLLGDCPPLDMSNGVDLDFLSNAPPPSGEGLIVEILIATDTGETDLGRLPLEAATRISGPNPAEATDLRATAFEAGQTGCTVRVLVDREALESPKTLPLLVEIDIAGTTLGGALEESGDFCTWLGTDTPRSAAIECVFGSAGGAPRRAWIRLAWTDVAATPTNLPAWATAALGRHATPPSDVSFVMRPLDAAPFARTDPPHLDASLQARGVAWRSGGWVLAGAYLEVDWDDKISSGDAIVWWSADGRTFERVDSASVFGGPGLQVVGGVVADDAGWWVIGAELTGSSFEDLHRAPLLWRSSDGTNWRRLAPPTEGHIGAAVGDGRGGLIAAAADSLGTPEVWRIDRDGRIATKVILELPTGEAIAEAVPIAIAGASGAYLIVGLAYPDLRTLAWTSVDGLSWSLLPAEAPNSLAALVDAQGVVSGSGGANAMAKTRLGWFVGGAGWVARSTDAQSWEVVLAEAGTWFSGFAEHRGTVVALSAGEAATAFSTVDGTSWRPVLFEGGVRPAPYSIAPTAGASDGIDLLIVGSRDQDAAVWITVEP